MDHRQAQSSQKLGVAVIGLGVGEQHARAYLALESCELRWLYDLDGSKAEHFANVWGRGSVAGSYEQILGDPQVDVVSIASFDDDHFGQVVPALEAGKHVFVEKPLCRTVDELRRIKQAWEQHRGAVKLSSNLILRAAPIYQWLEQKIKAGDFGRLYALDGEYLYGRLHKITEGWRKDVEDYSVILGGGVHMIDLMLLLSGERPQTIRAQGNRICTQDTPFRYNDYVTAILSFPSGLIGRITANFGCVHCHHHVLRVYGTKATFLYDDAGPRLHVTRDPNVMANFISLPTLPAAKGDLIPAFVSAILNDKDMNQHTQAMLDVISVCAACDEATISSEPVEVRYV
jgi:predicted dehydrogenase